MIINYEHYPSTASAVSERAQHLGVDSESIPLPLSGISEAGRSVNNTQAFSQTPRALSCVIVSAENADIR